MGVSRQQMLAMVLLVALPFCVAGLTAVGLVKLDWLLDNVAEEYAEARMLAPVDRDLGAAALALESEDPTLRSTARGRLERAEAGLLEYLATQYDDVGTEQHQAIESGHASELLRSIQDLLRAEGAVAEPDATSRRIGALRTELGVLLLAADNGVQSAHEAARRARESTLAVVFAASLASTAACVGLLVWSTRSLNRRLRGLHRRLAAQHPGAPKRASDVDGMVAQIEDLNSRMISKIEESGRELLRRERLAGIGLLAADVAHEINNPMNAMLGLSELGLKTIERGPVDESARAEMHESLRVMRREALRCKGIIERLMTMVRGDRRSGWFDATRLVQETVHVAQAARPDKASCFVAIGQNGNVRAYGPADDVRQILLTLLINAADAIAPNGRIEVDATQTEREVWLRVRDNGRGFTESMRQSFFTPFRSYSENGRGAGLGLSIAQALAEGMGATLRPYSDGPGTGSMFILAIPLQEAER